MMWFKVKSCFSTLCASAFQLNAKSKVVSVAKSICNPKQNSRNISFQQQYCYYSTTVKKDATTFTQTGLGVYILTTQNIYNNLAFEDWLYKNGNFDNGELLLLWRNQPCIVIGRHQNMWAECNILGALGQGVDIARRRSGGGTVYHDLGNLNCTFFTSRKRYNRKQNLEVLAQTLRDKWQLNVSVSKRDDMLLDDKFKISGTAAKLGRNTAYHHCTLLFDVHVGHLSSLLQSPMRGLESRATESTRSAVKNLCEVNNSINYTSLVQSVISQYFPPHHQHEVTYVDPSLEEKFPGISKLQNDLRCWDWIYGHSPVFSLRHSADGSLGGSTRRLTMQVTIEKGHIKSVNMELVGGGDSYKELLAEVCETLTGCRFWPMHISIALISTRLHVNSPELWTLLNSCFSGFLEPDGHIEHQRNNVSS